MFAIYRYIVGLEMLGPLLIAIGIGLLPVSRRIRFVALAVLLLATAATTRVDYIERSPVSDPFVQADLPKIEHPERAMVLLTGNGPLGFLAPSFPRQVPLLRIDGWMVQPQDGTRLTKMMKGRSMSGSPGSGTSMSCRTPMTWAGRMTRWRSTICASTG